MIERYWSSDRAIGFVACVLVLAFASSTEKGDLLQRNNHQFADLRNGRHGRLGSLLKVPRKSVEADVAGFPAPVDAAL